jgi:hypothetical protein
MKHAPVFSTALLFAVVWLFAPPSTFSQEAPSQEAPSQDATPSPAPPGSQPKPAGREYQPFGDNQESPPDATTTFTPDTTLLTGVFVPGIGSPEIQHRYWVPSLQYGNFIRSTGCDQPPGTGSDSAAGGANLTYAWSRSHLSVSYNHAASGGSGLFTGSSTDTVQDISETGCSVAACSSDLQHQVSLRFQWHTRPLVLG